MVFVDQLHREVEIASPPQRIVSLVPSQTELLFFLGLSDHIVGITKFCVHPHEHIKQIKKVGGTKNFNLDIIDQLKPDLIIANKEENDQEGIRELEKKYPVWISDVSSDVDAIAMIRSVGLLTDREHQANLLATEIEDRFSKLKIKKVETVLYFIWRNPWMAVGKHTYIDSMLSRIGLSNLIDATRYPTIVEEQIQHLKPDVIFLSSEPYPFKQVHVDELQQLIPRSKVVLVDGEMFSWYGSRMLLAPDYFGSLSW